ncbi:MAG: hypothetical protein DMG07_22810 [Acidobacteria bacterium]|nr:MAG: hypothetical protein DMG07_22810 [Acidobacteriota bacterium]
MMDRRSFLRAGAGSLVSLGSLRARPRRVPDKLVVLTFDDGFKAHRTLVAPLLRDLGFGATLRIS